MPRAGDAVARQTTYDAGLRRHMLSIYNYMASGVLLTGIVALLAYQRHRAQHRCCGNPLMWIVALSPLGDRLRDELRREPVQHRRRSR